MSSTFSENWGSLLTLKVRTRCGLSPLAFQIFHTANVLRPVALAILLKDQ
jgi:hypothetical protein